MTVYELNRDQLEELKQHYLCEHLKEVENRSPSWGELSDADNIIPDWLIFSNYDCYDFSPDDFFCSAGGEKQ